MPSCLGLFIEDNLIKYAKISKENDKVKVENYGVKFYEQDKEATIQQIIDSTFSYKTPISINITNAKYANAKIFSLLSESDQKKSIKTEFEYFCNDTGKNRLVLDYRAVLSNSTEDKDKKNVLYSYSGKGSIAERIQMLDGHRIAGVFPVPLTIPNLYKNSEENSIIVNIEDETEVTTIVNNKPVNVDIIELGMKEILSKISARENSINKAYEICKNTTLYTTSSQNLQTENNEYLEIIVPTIYKIVEGVKKVVEKNNIEIQNIYVTGTGTVINNIDLYFQENFLNYKCEILTPYFVDKTSLKLNIKDYIEVNSAISLALQGLDKKNRNINFDNSLETWEKIRELLNSDVSAIAKKSKSNGEKKNFKLKKPEKINLKEINCIRFAYGTFAILAIYIIVTAMLHNQIDKKILLTQETIDDTQTKTTTISKYASLVKSRTEGYQTILEQLQEASDRATQAYASKNAVPNLLHEIMFAVPKQVQILSIENTNEKHITIKAQSSGYQYLGFLKSELQNKAILVNVTSTSGTMVEGMIQVTIEGDLPY